MKQKKNELITRQSHLRPAVKNGANVENSSNNLASSSVFAVSTSNPTELVEAAPLPENVPKSEKKVSKSKRLGRAGLLLNIAGANQERFDWALRIFEAHIPRYWRRMRLMKRFRNIVKFEGTTRFQHAILKSTAIYSAAVKEWNQTDFHHDIDTFDSEWFELRNSGMPHFGHIHAFKGSSNHYDADTFSGVTGQVSDMLQGFIQAAVLASRAGLRFGILTATKKLWKAIRLCFRFKKFYAAVWKNTLWRGLNIAATTLLDLLQVGKLYSAAKSESFDSTADVDGKVIDHSGSSTLNYVEFSSGERVLLDLKMCSNLCIFAIEMSHLSGKKFRLELLVSKFRKVFGDTYDVILAGVLDSNLPPTTSLGMLFNTRKLTAAYIYDKFRPQRSLIPENSTALALPEIQAVFQNAIEFMSSLKSPLLSGLQLEFGNFLYDTGDIDAAIINWNQSLDTILKKPKFIRNWKNDYRVKGLEAGLLSIHQLERLKMECGGAKQTFMAANIVTMMARVVGSTNHLRRKEYLWLGASFFLAGVSRFGFNVYSGNDVIFNITEVFDDKFSCNPTSTVDNILYLCGNLLEICQHHLVLPLSKVILHIAAKYLLSQDLYVRATIIGSEALIGMGRIAEGVADLTSLARRPGKLDDTVPETSFDENTRILDCSHIKSFRQILSIQFPERYRPRFSSNAINDLEIAKASTVLYLLKYLMNRGFETSAELCDVMAAIQKSLITVAERIQSAIKPKSAPDTRYKEKVAPMPNYVGHYQRLATCFKLITKTYLYLKRYRTACNWYLVIYPGQLRCGATFQTCCMIQMNKLAHLSALARKISS